MAGINNRFFGKCENLSDNALDKGIIVPTGEAGISDACLKDRVAREKNTISFRVKNNGIGRMTGCMNHTQRELRIDLQCNPVAIFQMLHVFDCDLLFKLCRKVSLRAKQIIIRGFVCKYRHM